MECSMCSYLSPNATQHISHLRLVHSKDSNFNTTCCLDNCTFAFKSFGGFNSHIYRHHRTALGLNEPYLRTEDSAAHNMVMLGDDMDSEASARPPDELELSIRCGTGHDDGSLGCENNIGYDVWNQLDTSKLQQKKEAGAFILKLREVCRVSEKALADIIKGSTQLFNQSFSIAKAQTRHSLEQAGVDILAIDSLQSDLPDPFEDLDTIFKQDKYFKSEFEYLEPVEIEFGATFVNRFSGTKRQKVMRSKIFYYVPLYETLRRLLQHNDIQSELNTSRVVDGLNMNDFCDGSVFKNHPLFSTDKQAIQIIAYYDEMEVVNPIGSYVNKHKLGCLFFSLGNIRPQFRSSLRSIFLLAVGKHEDIAEYGIDKFLTPFVDDLKRLYIEGITVKVGSSSCTYFGGLLAFLADTLAAHLVGGFKGCMSFAKRICRSCMITTDEAQVCFIEDNCELRTPSLHEEQCQQLTGPNCGARSVEYGINRTSILQEISGYSVVNGMPHDVMHDLFEGVVKYELQLFLHHSCISKKYFRLETLNTRLCGFDFGVEDKPSTFAFNNDTHVYKVRQSAGQMISLVRNLPFLIGDLIPSSDENWSSLLILFKICQIALSPVITPDTIPYLKVLIEEKLCLLKRLYPSSTLKPKMHYLVHLPSQMELYGPLIHSWTMRHEAKLSFIKRASRSGNFKNICLTVTKHHQLWLCYQLKCLSHFLHPQMEISPKSSKSRVQNQPEHIQSQVSSINPSISPECVIAHPNWIKVHSSVYRIGTYLLLKKDDMYPEFGAINDILVLQDLDLHERQVLFCVQVYLTTHFSCHHNSFVVQSTSNTRVTDILSLHDYHPLTLRRSFDISDSNRYITLPSTF